MAKNRKTNNSRVKTSYIDPKTGQLKEVVGKPQIVYSESQKLFKEKYLTAKGKRLFANKEISKDEAWAKYGKNRYIINPNAKPIKVIVHQD